MTAMALALVMLLVSGLIPMKSNADVYFPGAYGRPGLDWQRINPLPVSESLYTVAYGNGTWVAVSDHHVYSSPDGDTWAIVAPLQTYQQRGIRAFFAGGRFLVSGGKEALLSTDGRTWSDSAGLTAIAEGPQGCVAIVGGRGVFAPDCRTWQDAGLHEPAERVYAVGARYFILDHAYRLHVSADGMVWREPPEGRSTAPDFMAYAGGQYLSFDENGDFAASPDGLTWGPSQPVVEQWIGWVLAVASDGAGLFLLGSEDVILRSADGVHWEKLPRPPGWGWRALATGGGRVLVAGDGGAIVHSEDGQTWTQVNHGPTQNWGAPVFGHGRFVAAAGFRGALALYSSADGVNWQFQRLVRSSDAKAKRLAFTGERFLIFGTDGVSLVSADGLQWEPAPEPLASGRVLSDGGPLLLAGQSGLLVSSDGGAFRALTAPDMTLRAGVFDGERYVLVGGNQIATSADGEHWVTTSLGSIYDLRNVVAGNGHYVACDAPGPVFSSADGLSWERVPDMSVYWVRYAGDRFEALGGENLLLSPDGRTWTDYYLQPMVGMVFGNGRHVATGNAGVIMVDGPAVAPASPAPAADPVRSSIAVDAAENMGQPYTVTVTLRDAEGRPLAGRPVLLEDFRGLITLQVFRTDERGRAAFPFLYHGAPLANTYWAQDVLSGRWLAGTVSITPRACGTRFADVPATDGHCQVIESAVARGLIGGYPDGTFRGEGQLTRAELAKVALLTTGGTPQPDGPLPFADVADHWAARAGYIQGAAALGLMKGDPDGAFRPDAPVSRAELIKVITVLAGLSPEQEPAAYADVSPDAWYAPWAATAVQNALIGNRARSRVYPQTEALAGNLPATRLDAACMLTNLYQLEQLNRLSTYQ